MPYDVLPSSPSRFSRVARGVLAAVALVALPMCEGPDHVDVTAKGTSTVPAATVLSELLSSFDFLGFDSVDFSEQFQNQGVTKDDVDSVKTKSFTLNVDAPSDGNFDFLQSVAFYVEADGQPKVEIAHLDSVPTGQKSLTLDVENVELKPYVVASSMKITSTVSGKLPSEETTVSAEVTLDVNVHVGVGCF